MPDAKAAAQSKRTRVLQTPNRTNPRVIRSTPSPMPLSGGGGGSGGGGNDIGSSPLSSPVQRPTAVRRKTTESARLLFTAPTVFLAVQPRRANPAAVAAASSSASAAVAAPVGGLPHSPGVMSPAVMPPAVMPRLVLQPLLQSSFDSVCLSDDDLLSITLI